MLVKRAWKGVKQTCWCNMGQSFPKLGLLKVPQWNITFENLSNEDITKCLFDYPENYEGTDCLQLL
jgi:hypothetical protein